MARVLHPAPSPRRAMWQNRGARQESQRSLLIYRPLDSAPEARPMTPRELEEYTALRATIRERGSLRVTLFLATLFAWGGATIATAALAALPVAALLPLLLLAAGFEGVLSLHTGVERIGRYLQVFYEADAACAWERTAMAYGKQFPGGPDPLFSAHFALAAALNFVPVL